MGCFNIITFTLVACIALCCSAVGSTYTRAAFTTLERFYGLTTTELAMYTSVNQMIAVIITPFMVSITKNRNIPRVLWISFLVKALAFMTLALPYFLAPKYVPDVGGLVPNELNDKTQNMFCKSSTNETIGDGSSDNIMKYWSLFIPLGKLLLGIGGCVVWPHMISYIDNNSKPGQSVVLIAINLTVVLIGPIIGYKMAGFVLKKWVNFLTETAPVEIDERGSEWVGAWWLGYIIVVIGILVTSTPLAFFPQKLTIESTDKEIEEQKITNAEDKKLTDELKLTEVFDDTKTDETGFFENMFEDTKCLLQNPLFLMQVIAAVVSSWAMAVKSTFGQKYLEIQFALTPAEAANLKVWYIITLCLGFLCGGLVVKFRKMKALGVMRFCTINQLIYTCVCLSLWYLPGCTPQRPEDLFGVQANESLADCECGTDQFVPMCGKQFEFNSKNYTETTILSPCKAGCNSVLNNGTERLYIGCDEFVERGVCNPDDCDWRVMVYISVMSFGTFLSGLNGSPGTVFLMRAVRKDQKAYATALIGVCMKLLAWVPGPIIFGRLFEAQCVVHGEKGNCVFYDNTNVQNFLFGILSGISIAYCTTLIMFYVLFVRRLKSKKPMWGGMNTEEPF